LLVLLIHLLGHLLELFGLCAALGHVEQLFGMASGGWKPGCYRRTIVQKPGFQPGCACSSGTIVRVFSLVTVKKRPRPAKISEEKQVRAWEFWRKFATFSYTDTPNHYICQPAVRIRSPRSEDRTIVLDGTRLDLTLGYCYLCQLIKPNNSSASCPDPVRICWETRTFFTNGW
jgi:hypothetical protein